MNGRGERIRTSGLLDPNQALYQAEPRPEKTSLASHYSQPRLRAFSVRAFIRIHADFLAFIDERWHLHHKAGFHLGRFGDV